MDKLINERFIKLSSRIPFHEDIALSDDIPVTIKGREYLFNCVKQEMFDNQDNTIDMVYVLKSLIE